MNNYELTVILKNGEAESLTAKVKEILQKFEAKIVKEDAWGLKKLAYTIMDESDGYYLYLELEAPSDSVAKISAEFKLISSILRYMFIEPKNKKAKA